MNNRRMKLILYHIMVVVAILVIKKPPCVAGDHLCEARTIFVEYCLHLSKNVCVVFVVLDRMWFAANRRQDVSAGVGIDS